MSKHKKGSTHNRNYSFWDEDDYDDNYYSGTHIGSHNRTISHLPHVNYSKSIWQGFDWGAIHTRTESKEEINKFKEAVKKEADKHYMAVKVNVSGIYSESSFFYTGRYVVNIPIDELNKFKTNVPKLIASLQKLPPKSHSIHSMWVAANMGFKRETFLYNFSCYSNWGAFKQDNDKYFNGTLSYDDFITKFKEANIDTKKGTNGGWSAGLFHGGDDVGHLHILKDFTNYKLALQKIGKKLVKQAANYYEESYRKGSRINPKFITSQSQHPLLKKDVFGGGASQLPRVMVILDCSGSMGGGGYHKDRSNMSVSFAGALATSGVCELTHAVYHSDRGWADLKKRLDKGELGVLSGGGDGFQYMDDNLPSEWVKNCDYVLVLTDLEYSETNQGGLLEYVKRAPAHLILSFNQAPLIDGIKCDKVGGVEDMVKSFMKMNSKISNQLQ